MVPEIWRRLTLGRVGASIGFITDPFWLSVLAKAYRLQVRDLVTKTRVPIPPSDGCRVLGIPDPISALDEGEIFLLCEYEVVSPLGTRKVRQPVVGDVMVYRNPCLHPGDVQRLKAVDKPSLYQYLNVLVLPTVGRRSVAACCSGGDLDGDMFSVIWATDLVPPAALTHPALDYDAALREATEASKSASAASCPPFTRKHMSTFFCKVVTNDTLGKIAHMHLALSDASPSGALDLRAQQLAKAQSLAVDFPKTGVLPLVPHVVLTIIRARGYPDFMQKTHYKVYTSRKTLGTMFRRCVSLDVDFETMAPCDVDQALLVPERVAWRQAAKAVYQRFKREMVHLLASHGLKHEAEAVLGMPLHCPPTTSNRETETKRIHTRFEYLMKKYREEFFDDRVKPGNKWAKCSAWYEVAYSDKTTHQCRSFVWCIGDILCEIKSKQSPSVKPECGVHALIGKDAMVTLTKHIAMLQPVINTRLEAARSVQKTLETHSQSKSNITGRTIDVLCTCINYGIGFQRLQGLN